MADQDPIFAGYFEPLKKWDDSTKKYEEFNESVVGKFNFTLNEFEDLKKYATNPADTSKPRRVYFELKTAKSGKLYAVVNDPSTWVKKDNAPSGGAQPREAFQSNEDDLPF